MAQTPGKGWYLRFPYLWKEEERQGHDEPAKHRPCVIIGALGNAEDSHYLLAPITHSPPTTHRAIVLTAEDCKLLWLDRAATSYLVVSEMNLVSRADVERHLPKPTPGQAFYRRHISQASLVKAILGFKESVQEKRLELVDRPKLAAEMRSDALTYRRKQRLKMKM